MLTLLTVPLTRPVLLEQLQCGLILLVLGMGTVFVFLTLLIASTKLLSKVCARIAPAKSVAATTARPKTNAAPAKVATKDAEVAAAIAAAYQRSKN